MRLPLAQQLRFNELGQDVAFRDILELQILVELLKYVRGNAERDRNKIVSFLMRSNAICIRRILSWPAHQHPPIHFVKINDSFASLFIGQPS